MHIVDAKKRGSSSRISGRRVSNSSWSLAPGRSWKNALRNDNFNLVREPINGEIAAVDGQDLVDSRIGVDYGEHNRVNVRK